MEPLVSPVVLGALDKATDVAGKLGLLQKLLAKLIGDPDSAAQHLAVALGEVDRTFGSLHNTIREISYLGVPGQEQVDVLRELDRIDSEDLLREVIRAKGSCSKIRNIYNGHLKAWFKILVKPDEDAQLKVLFDDLSDSDGWAIDALEKLVIEAKPLVQEIRPLIIAGNEAEARRRVDAFVKGLRPALEKLNATMASMRELEAKFILQSRLT